MPNWKKLIVSGSDAALNSLNVTSALTASGLNYPSSDGTDGQVLLTDGSGVLSFSDNITYVTVKNVSSGTLTKGTPVHSTGTSGNTPEIIAASASVATSMPAGFVLAEDIAATAEGRAVLSGFLNGVDTNGLSEGANVYVGASGGYTTTKPTSDSNLIQNIAIIGKSDANGSLYIIGAGRSNDVPNLPEGKIWVGSSNYTVTSSVAHLDESNGRLGIGTTSPSEKLTVEGNISGSGYIQIGTGHTNSGTLSSIVGGTSNTISGTCSTIGGGSTNCVSGNLSFVGGGTENDALANCTVVVGGWNNSISGLLSSMVGGRDNCISAAAWYGFIGGGQSNAIRGNYGFIGGGCSNSICSLEQYSVIGGGQSNILDGDHSGILGGNSNCIVHDNSFIVGSNLTSSAACTTFMNNLDVEGTVSASAFSGSFVGDGSGLTGITADSVPFTGITGTPTIISSSLQFDTITSPFTGSFTGSFTGDGSGLTNIIAEVTEQATVSDTFTSTTSKVVTHNFGTKNVIVIVYNSSDQQILPATLTTTDNNNVTVTFDTATSGRVVVAKGGHIVSGSVPYSTLIGKPFFEGSQTNITSGSVTNINTIPTSSYSAAIFDYAAYSSSNARAGTLTSTNVGTTITYNEVSTSDIGDTTPLELSVVISGSNFTLQALTSTSGWAVKSHGTGI